MIRPTGRAHPTAARFALALAALLIAAVAPAGRADAAAWGTPTTLSAPGHPSQHVRIGTDTAGDQVAAWESVEGSEWAIVVATKTAGGSWGAPVELSVPGQEAREPALAVDAAGEAVVAWDRNGGAHELIEVARGGVSGGWSAPVAISDPTTISFLPQVGLDAAGDAVASWRQEDESTYVAAVAVEEGGSWGAPQILSDPVNSNEPPSLTVDSAGDAVVAWDRQEAVEASSRQAGSGTWSAPTILASSVTGIAGQVELAIDGTGEALAIWPNDEGGHTVIESARMGPIGTWGGSAVVSSNPDSNYAPDVVLTAPGDATAVWANFNSGTSHYQLETATSTPFAPWTEPAVIGTSPEVAEPKIALDPAGDATVLWWGWVPETHNYSTWAEQRPAGGVWGARQTISETGEETYFPVLDMDGSGGATAVWNSFEGFEIVRSVNLPGPRKPAPVVDPAGGGADDTQKAPTGAPVCSAVTASPSAETYVPSPRLGKTVPGVRSRITVGVPSAVEVAATLTYKLAGKSHSVAAGSYSMSIGSKRNLRIPLPGALRTKLPLGTKVGAALRIVATPNSAGTCGKPSTAMPHLKLKVVRVLSGV